MGRRSPVPRAGVRSHPPRAGDRGEARWHVVIFVTDGLESALAQAREAAGDKDIAVAGGASLVQQCIQAGFLDEMQIHLVPMFLGEGVRLFDQLGDSRRDLEVERAIHSLQ